MPALLQLQEQPRIPITHFQQGAALLLLSCELILPGMAWSAGRVTPSSAGNAIGQERRLLSMSHWESCRLIWGPSSQSADTECTSHRFCDPLTYFAQLRTMKMTHN